mmetsp:Transcript_31487/g.66240  ORF Transcript_31487/g.66240 Transcript_31487/m.66240 type:complete len:125 (+) Transcript_31487:959-1333(+)
MSPLFDIVLSSSCADATAKVDMTRETITPNTTIDTSLHPIPAKANRSGRFPTYDMAGEIPTAANAATLKEEALMKYPNYAVEKRSLFASTRGRMVVNAEEDTPLSHLMKSRGPIVGCRRKESVF